MSSVTGNKKSWVLLIVAVVVAILAFWLSTRYLQNKETAIRSQIQGQVGSSVKVVVASAPLRAGDVLGATNMAVAEVSSEFLSPAVITPDRFSLVDGKVLSFPMASGEPLLTHYLGDDSVSRFSELLNSGERAVSFEIDNINAVSGMVLPGDFIDIALITRDSEVEESAMDDQLLVPLLDKVRVLSVDAISLVSRDDDFFRHDNSSAVLDYGTVTVAVTYKNAGLLTLARKKGDLTVFLRNSADTAGRLNESVAMTDYIDNKAASGGYEFLGGSMSKEGVIESKNVAIQNLGGDRRSARLSVAMVQESKKDVVVSENVVTQVGD
ncbi:Flp pilus assembly protein CpaB [Gilvimarinus agarilyticus]|uniref:Flp pilus assembly protein CpaB n=1 Tax=Gilvimarinus agarilyticus TaxID=679259 RepID=UPI00059F9547|nr:Flp pilus assembly protein CpaB [Gilvimarinus agarilyticus]